MTVVEKAIVEPDHAGQDRHRARWSAGSGSCRGIHGIEVTAPARVLEKLSLLTSGDQGGSVSAAACVVSLVTFPPSLASITRNDRLRSRICVAHHTQQAEQHTEGARHGTCLRAARTTPGVPKLCGALKSMFRASFQIALVHPQ